SLRSKIALILLLPVAALLLLAGLRVGSSVSTSRQAAKVRGLTEFALRGTALAHELQRERGLTLGGLLAGEPAQGLREQRLATNRAPRAYRARAADRDTTPAPAAGDRGWLARLLQPHHRRPAQHQRRADLGDRRSRAGPAGGGVRGRVP